MRISDWSSDVCSSDLARKRHADVADHRLLHRADVGDDGTRHDVRPRCGGQRRVGADRHAEDHQVGARSEESRGGKECVSKYRSRRPPTHYKQKLPHYHTLTQYSLFKKSTYPTL